MASDPRASTDPIERLRALKKDDLPKLPKSEQQRLVAEANSALFLLRKEQQQQAQAPSWSTPSHGYRGGGFVRGRGTYRGRGYRYSPYNRGSHRHSSIRIGPNQSDFTTSVTPTTTPLVQSSSSPQPATDSRKELVVLNGMPFWRSSDGTTLTRAVTDKDCATSPETPERVELEGTTYVRGTDGHMHGTPLQTNHGGYASKLCRDYTSIGKCWRGNTCHFLHDDAKKAICKEFLYRGVCTERCAMSHEPSAHNTPPCNFFVKGLCTNDSCRYAHVKVSKDAPVCHPFGELGWCEKGAACLDLHAFECPWFSNTGVCLNKKCKLPHVAVAKRDTRAVSSSGEAGGTFTGGKRNDVGGDFEADGLNRAGDQKMEYARKGEDTNPEASDLHEDVHDLSDQDDYVPLGVDN